MEAPSTSQPVIEDGQQSVLLGSGTIQSCGVIDLLSGTQGSKANFLSASGNAQSNIDCILKCSVTVTVPQQGKEESNGSPDDTPKSKENDCAKVESPEFDLDSDDQDNVPLREILDKLQANNSDDSPESPHSQTDNLIRLHAQPDGDSPTISATVNVAALDLSDPDSIYRHLSELNDTVLRVSAKNATLAPDQHGQSGATGVHLKKERSEGTPTPDSKQEPPESSSDVGYSIGASPSSSGSQGVPEETSFRTISIQLPSNPMSHASSACSPSPSGSSSNLQDRDVGSNSPRTLVSSSGGGGGGGGKNLPLHCNICMKLFSNGSALTKHKLTHSEERKFQCSICSKSFKRQDHLNGHLLTHRSTKPYACQYEGCEKSYCDARSLRRHKDNHHHKRNQNHHHRHPMLSVPQKSSTTQSPCQSPIVASLACAAKLGIQAQTSSPVIARTALGDTKIMFSSKGLTAHQLQLIEQLLKDSKGTKLGQVTTAAGSGLPPSIPISVTFPINPTTFVPTFIAAPSKAQSPIHSPTANGTCDGSHVCDRPVACGMCSRKFKNIPALNGHMRLHGGYLKKEEDVSPGASPPPPPPPPSKNNTKPAKGCKGIKRKNSAGSVGDCESPTLDKKFALCPVNLQSPRQAALFSVASTSSMSTLPNGSIIAIDSSPIKTLSNTDGPYVAVQHHHHHQHQPTFQSLPQPDTNTLLENLEKKNQQALLSIKTEQVQVASRVEGLLQVVEKPMMMSMTNGLSMSDQPPHTVLLSNFNGTSFPALFSLPHIALPTKPIPQMQLEKATLLASRPDVKPILVEAQNGQAKYISLTTDARLGLGTHHTVNPTTLRFNQTRGSGNFMPDHCPSSGAIYASISNLGQPILSQLLSSPLNQPSLSLASSEGLKQARARQAKAKQIRLQSGLTSILQQTLCGDSMPASPSDSAPAPLVSSPPITAPLKSKMNLQIKVDVSTERSPRVGPEYQACIPDFRPKKEDPFKVSADDSFQDILLWDPVFATPGSSMDEYLSLASSCAVPYGSHNEELALEVLLKHCGSMPEALQDLLCPPSLCAMSQQDFLNHDEWNEDINFDSLSNESVITK